MEGVFMPRPITELVILGMGQSSQSWPGFISDRADFSGEVWTINAGGMAFQHDVVFDMHTEEYVFSQDEVTLNRILARRKWLETHNKPVVMPKALPRYPTSLSYPLKLVHEKTNSDYFACGMAYMLAMAFLCDVKLMIIMGCDYIAQKTDRDGTVRMEDGRACVEYWIGRMAERGCKFMVTEKSPLCGASTRGSGKVYGYHRPLKEMISEGTDA
jgi:hypothetical protein